MQCPFCAKAIADDSKFCPFCGQSTEVATPPVAPPPMPAEKAPVTTSKNNSSLFMWLCIVACILLIAVLVLSAILFLDGQEQREENARLSHDYNQTVDELNALRQKSDQLQEHLDFYNTYAVIVTQGSRQYHCHGCDKLDTQSFWIYNRSAAEQEGYYPCPSCHD